LNFAFFFVNLEDLLVTCSTLYFQIPNANPWLCNLDPKTVLPLTCTNYIKGNRIAFFICAIFKDGF
jgi:hypothetical protein